MCETGNATVAIRARLFMPVTHFVIPLLTPELQARIPFILLIRLLFPTLGKPEGKKINNSDMYFEQSQRSQKKMFDCLRGELDRKGVIVLS